MTQAVKTWRILDILKVTETAFTEKGLKNPRLNAELLLADTLGVSRISLYLDFEKPLRESELNSYREKVKRRLSYEPLQYIRGFAEFYGKKFNVNPSVLIPRPETELLVEMSIDVISNSANKQVLEIGTGSGCVAISIASAFKEDKNFNIDSIDISPAAIETARKNAEMNNIENVCFKLADIFKDFEIFDGYSVIVSNPPYISANDIEYLDKEVKDFEPLDALTDKKDGLDIYRKMFELYNKTDLKPEILVEIGDGKKNAMEELLREFSITNYNIYKDLMKIDRVLHIGVMK